MSIRNISVRASAMVIAVAVWSLVRVVPLASDPQGPGADAQEPAAEAQEPGADAQELGADAHEPAAVVVETTPWSGEATGTVRMQSETSGAGELSLRLDVANALLLVRERVSTSGERDNTGGFESAALSVGPLDARGFLRSVEAPQSTGPLSDSLLDGGGYRIARSGGYNRPPGIALRSRRAGIFYNLAEDGAITGASLDWSIRLRELPASVVRAFAVLATPAPNEEGDEWELDRRAPVSGPLWYLGLESVSELGRGEVVVSSGPKAMPALLVTGVADLSGPAGELRAGFSAATEEFAGSDGERSEYRFRLGLRLSRSRAHLVRPRLQAEYAHLARVPMPAERIPREYGGAARFQFGPDILYLQPSWSADVLETAGARVRIRQEAGVRISAGGDALRVSAGAMRRIDDEEAGLVRADTELRFRIDSPGCGPAAWGEGRRSPGAGVSGPSGGEAGARACTFHTAFQIDRDDAVEDRAFDYWDTTLEPRVSARVRAAVRGEALQASLGIVFGEGGIPVSQLAGALGAPASHSAAQITLEYSGELPHGLTRAPTRR